MYGYFTHSILTRRHSTGSDDRSSRQQPTGPQVTHLHVHNNRGLDFWDYLLLRNLSGGHTTVINNPDVISGGQLSREDKKKDAEDSRKSLALGIVVAVVCVAFILVCVFGTTAAKKRLKDQKK